MKVKLAYRPMSSSSSKTFDRSTLILYSISETLDCWSKLIKVFIFSHYVSVLADPQNKECLGYLNSPSSISETTYLPLFSD